jgi:hypothetical protein
MYLEIATKQEANHAAVTDFHTLCGRSARPGRADVKKLTTLPPPTGGKAEIYVHRHSYQCNAL